MYIKIEVPDEVVEPLRYQSIVSHETARTSEHLAVRNAFDEALDHVGKSDSDRWNSGFVDVEVYVPTDLPATAQALESVVADTEVTLADRTHPDHARFMGYSGEEHQRHLSQLEALEVVLYDLGLDFTS